MNKKSQAGFVMLFATLIATVVLAIALGVAEIAYKETALSTTARDGEYAFYAADSGAECALYFDYKTQPSIFSSTSTPSLNCTGISGTGLTVQAGVDSIGLYDQFNFNLSNNAYCSLVRVYKDVSSADLEGADTTSTVIDSRGYNVPCTQAVVSGESGDNNSAYNARRVERLIEVTYPNNTASIASNNNGSTGGSGGSGSQSGGVVTGVQLLSGGSGYSTGMSVTTTGGSGTGLTLDITVSGGVITSVTIDQTGSGYVAGDIVTITTGNSTATVEITGVSGGAGSGGGGGGGTTNSPTTPGGIYVSLLNTDYSLPSGSSYIGTGVNGFDIYANWSQLEPSHNSYSWGILDNQITVAQQANLPYIIGVESGQDMPSWMDTGGSNPVEVVPVTEERSSGKVFSYDSPVPWDPHYLADLNGFIQALKAHLAAESYQNLIGIQLSGMNDGTMEVRLPGCNTIDPANPQPVGIPDTPATLAAIDATYQAWLATLPVGSQNLTGLTNTEVSTWQTIASYWTTAFPSSNYLAEFISPYNGFPLSSTQCEQTASQNTQQRVPDAALMMATSAASTYGSQVTIMGTYLNGDHNSPPDNTDGIYDSITTAEQGGAQGGYQLEENAYDDYSDTYSAPSTQTSFTTALQNGINTGAIYFEVYPADVQAYPGVIQSIGATLPGGSD